MVDAKRARQGPLEIILQEAAHAELIPVPAQARFKGAPVERFVEGEARARLACAVIARGFLRVDGNACGDDRLVAFSC